MCQPVMFDFLGMYHPLDYQYIERGSARRGAARQGRGPCLEVYDNTKAGLPTSALYPEAI